MRNPKILHCSILGATLAVSLYVPVLLVAQSISPTLYPNTAVNTTTLTWLGPVGNGGNYANWLPSGQPGVLSLHDPNGAMSWANRYVNDTGSGLLIRDRAITSNGDLVGSSVYHDGGVSDSGSVTAFITRIASNGSVTWSRSARTNFWIVPTGLPTTAVALGPDDEAFVLGGSSQRNILFKFTSSGEHVWSRWIQPEVFNQATHVISDGQGGCYLGCHREFSSVPFQLIHLDPDGMLISDHLYQYASPTAYLNVYDMALAPNGDVIVGGTYNVTGASVYFYLLRIAPDGQIIWFNFYLLDQVIPESWTGGGLLVTADGAIWLNDRTALLKADGSGTGILGFGQRSSVTGVQRTRWTLNALRPVPSLDTILVAGTRIVQDTILGTSNSHPFIAPVPDVSGSCYMRPAIVSTIPAGSALSAQVVVSSIDPRYTTTSVVVGTNIAVDVLLGEEMCAPTSINDTRRSATASLTLFPSLVEQGGNLRVMCSEFMFAEIHDPNGKLIRSFQTGPASNETSIDLLGMTQGMYLVRAVDRSGRPMATARFVVY